MGFTKKKIKVINSKGLHARPATIFVEEAKKYDIKIKVQFKEKSVNGKSLLALMSLGVPKDGIVDISIEGTDAEKALDQLTEILGKNYD